MTLRWREEDLTAFEKRTAEFRKPGAVRTHLIAPPMNGVDIDAIHRKYKNHPTEVDGITFASKREAERYKELKLLEKGKAITNLQLQVSFDLIVKGHKICRYVADFVYSEKCVQKVEDCKGVRTRDYILKKKLMKAIHGIEVKET